MRCVMNSVDCPLSILGVSRPNALIFLSLTSHSAASGSKPGKCSSSTPWGPCFRVPVYLRGSPQNFPNPVLNKTMALMLFKPNIVQQTPNENFRVRKNKDEYLLEIQLPGEWKRMYDFGLEPQLQMDYEVANWYTSTNPNSKFTQMLVVARSEPGIRYTLSGNLFSIHHVNKKPRKKILTTRAQLIKSLEEIFLINLSGLPLRKLSEQVK